MKYKNFTYLLFEKLSRIYLYECFNNNIYTCIGEVISTSVDSEGVTLIEVKCMERADGGKSWRWPVKEDKFKYLISDIVRKIRSPVPYSATYRHGRNETYIFED